MTWNGLLLDSTQVNLNLHIDLDYEQSLCPIARLPNEVWIQILDFLFLKEIFNLKFLSRRFNEIFFLSKKVRFLNRLAKKLFDVNDYYEKLIYFLDRKLIKRIKKDCDFSTYLFLKYSFESMINECMISNCLFHLFNCPRSYFAKNTCLNCSRIYVKKDVFQPENFKRLIDFDFKHYFDMIDLPIQSQNIIKQFKFIIFFDSDHQLEIINSNRKRCLNMFIVQEHVQFLLLFFEVQLRILINFFYNLSKNISEEMERKFFIRNCLSFTHKFVVYCVDKIRSFHFKDIFEEIEYSQFDFIKVINKNYIEFCKKKYAN